MECEPTICGNEPVPCLSHTRNNPGYLVRDLLLSPARDDVGKPKQRAQSNTNVHYRLHETLTVSMSLSTALRINAPDKVVMSPETHFRALASMTISSST